MSMSRLMEQNRPSEAISCADVGFRLISVSRCFCRVLPSMWFQLSNVIKSNCRKPTYEIDLKLFELTQQEIHLFPVTRASGM